MNMNTVFKFIAVAGVATLLASCSGEPSEQDISSALDTAMRAEQQQLKGLTAGLAGNGAPTPLDDMLDVTISNLEKVGCQENGEKAYLCDIRYTITGSIFGKQGKPMAGPIRLISASDGWVIAAR
jgi:hypothetical protein